LLATAGKSNYAINPTPEQALRSNRAVLPARVIAALDVHGGMVRIREAVSEDVESLERLQLAAFGEEGAVVAGLVRELMHDESATPRLALVAVSEKEIIGSVIFSSVKIIGVKELMGFILAPLAVAPKNQRSGIGTNLIRYGLAALREIGADVVFVYGNPVYYSKFGFNNNHQVLAPFQIAHPEGWLALQFRDDPLDVITGKLVCANSLNRREHW
jgi:putative acetyltransferase